MQTISPPRVHRPAAVLAVLLTAPFMAQVDATIVNVATPTIRLGLDASEAAIELVVGGYLIAQAVLVITGARLGQTHGYRRVFLLGIAVFGAASLACGLATDALALVVTRVIQGVGAALMFPQALTGIQLTFGGQLRARAIGLYAVALSTGAICGQILGGVLVAADVAGTGWRAIFLINVPVCVLVVSAGRRLLPDDGDRGGARVDLPGVGTLSAALLLLVVPLTLGREQGWPVWSWASLVAFVPAAALFVLTQRRATSAGRTPLVHLGLLAEAPVAWGLGALLIATSTYYALLFSLAQYVQTATGRGSLFSGLILVPWVAAFGLAGQITRRLPVRFATALPPVGYLLLTAAYLGLGGALLAGRPGVPVLAGLLALGGLGLGVGFTTLVGHLTGAAPPRYASDMSGVSTTTLLVGGSFGVAVFGGLYLVLAAAGPGAGDHALAVTCLAMSAGAALALVAARLATRTTAPA